MVTKGNVLVVDDEINLCRILGAKLTKSGYSVVAVHDGAQAVEKVRESDFDLVLLDLVLPKKDGLTALAEIRSMRSGLPVIVMTACESAEALAQARSHGVSAYVNKPFDLDSLVTLVNDTSGCKASGSTRKMPDSTLLFTPDQPITVEIQNGFRPQVYNTRIFDKDERTLSVIAPCNADKPIEVAPRTLVKVGLAARDAYYSFISHVLKALKTPNHILVLDKPSVIYRVQRREHQRVKLSMPVDYARFYAEDVDQQDYNSAQLLDISLGGMRIAVPEEMKSGDILTVSIRPTASVKQINVIAQVLRSEPNGIVGEPQYVLGCKFTCVEESIRTMLSH
jgi:CheY-like chemotaxis protein